MGAVEFNSGGAINTLRRSLHGTETKDIPSFDGPLLARTDAGTIMTSPPVGLIKPGNKLKGKLPDVRATDEKYLRIDRLLTSNALLQ